MGQHDQAKRLKAFAKKRESRVQVVIPPASNQVRLRTECLGEITTAIINSREADRALRDGVVIETLRYECHEAGSRAPAASRFQESLQSLRARKNYETAVWRGAIKSILEMADPQAAKNRNSTQLLDLLETVVQ